MAHHERVAKNLAAGSKKYDLKGSDNTFYVSKAPGGVNWRVCTDNGHGKKYDYGFNARK